MLDGMHNFLGRFLLLSGWVLAVMAVILLLSSLPVPSMPGDLVDSLWGFLSAFTGGAHQLMDPDEYVYDFTLGTNVPRIYELKIPKINLDAPVVRVGEKEIQIGNASYSQLAVPHAFAVGWNERSAPIGGSGNTVFVGHNNIYGEVFKDLWSLQTGDEIVVQTGSGARSYRVSKVITLEESNLSIQERVNNASWIRPTDHGQLTLVTCYPYASNTHRLIVVAYPA